MRKTYVTILAGLFLCLFLAAPSGVSAAKGEAGGDVVTIPADATQQQITDIMAGLSDTQARSLLLEELKKQVDPAPIEKKDTGIAGVISHLKEDVSFVRQRFVYLFSGASTAHRELPTALKGFLGGNEAMGPGMILLALASLTVLWVGGTFLFKRRTRKARKTLADAGEAPAWYNRMWRLFLRALLDLFGVSVVGLVTTVSYLVLFESDASAKPVALIWLLAMFFLSVVKIFTRFLLAPHAPSLRYLPLSNDAAQYLFKWTIFIARILAVGMLINSILRLHGSSEAVNLLVTTGFGFMVAFSLTLLILWNKKPMAEAIRHHAEEGGLVYQLADSWHALAIAYVLGSWLLWVFALMLMGSEARLIGVLTLLLVPAFLLVDWVTQQLVNFAVEMASSNEEHVEGEKEKKGLLRFQSFLRKGFRFLVVASTIFLLLRIWGIDLPIGREVSRAAMSTLLTVVLAYIFWIYINGLIERKIKEKEPQEGGESGEGGGGPGGDRFSTLLQLVKKFIFVSIAVVTLLIVLSSLGIDIGPLIAGASVFGLAIGFGAQTLVKDIISGIFFLMDDAFRVGDYIIVGSARGTVEEISIRSFKLRHHLGPLYTVPFGSIKEVQNMTRDWAVMKLQYLVPFDTDIGKVKKIIKKINKEVRSFPELNEFMLSDIKSQGVKAMEEYGMRMRVKFMTKPGGQFTLRKLVLAKMRKEFEAAGIEFAKPRVSVSLPENSRLSPEEEALVAAAASKAAEKKVPADGAKKKKA